MIHETITPISAMTTTVRARHLQPTTIAYPIKLYISTIHGKQKRQIPMSQILSMSNGTLLRVCTSLAPLFGHLLPWVVVRPMIPSSRPCSKVFPPYLKAQQTQMQMPKVDRKREIFAPDSIQLMSIAQNLHLRIHFLITTFFIVIIAPGLPPLVRPAVDRRSQQLTGYGLNTGPMRLRTTAT